MVGGESSWTSSRLSQRPGWPSGTLLNFFFLMRYFMTSSAEVMFSLAFVCLSVFQQDISRSNRWICLNFVDGLEADTDLDHFFNITRYLPTFWMPKIMETIQIRVSYHGLPTSAI